LARPISPLAPRADGSHLRGATALIAIAGLLIYTGSFAIGLGPVFWLLISEIYPVKIRGQAMSVATMANWGANFAVTISSLTVLGILGGAGTFFLFAGLTIIALAYFQRQVPETKSRSLQDIERDLALPRPDERLPWLGAARRISASIRSGSVRRPASQAAAADSARRHRCDLRDNRQNYSCW
jgi:MFS family permease